jgi:glucose dehydrogenase
MRKGVYYIWAGIVLILAGVYYWYSTPAELTLSAGAILVGTAVWIHGDIKSGIKLW